MGRGCDRWGILSSSVLLHFHIMILIVLLCDVLLQCGLPHPVCLLMLVSVAALYSSCS